MGFDIMVSQAQKVFAVMIMHIRSCSEDIFSKIICYENAGERMDLRGHKLTDFFSIILLVSRNDLRTNLFRAFVGVLLRVFYLAMTNF